MIDLTDVAAWVGAATGLGSLFLTWRAPARREQRDLRAAVRADAELVLSRIETSRKVAATGGELDIPHPPHEPLERWASQRGRFTSKKIPNAIAKHGTTLLQWRFATHDYKQALADHDSTVKLSQSHPRFTQQHQVLETNRVLGVRTTELSTAAQEARVAVEEIIGVINRLDRRS